MVVVNTLTNGFLACVNQAFNAESFILKSNL